MLSVAGLRQSLPRLPHWYVKTVVALTTGAAALIQGIVVPERLRVYLPFGVLFAVAAGVQCLAALMLVGRSSHVLDWVIAGNALVMGLWLITRILGVPIGVEPWAQEAIGPLDSLCAFLAAIAALTGVLQLRRMRSAQAAAQA